MSGVGQQRVAAIVNLVAYYPIGIPFGLVMWFGWAGMKLTGLLSGLVLACLINVLSLARLLSRIDWDEQAKQAADRLELDHQARATGSQGDHPSESPSDTVKLYASMSSSDETHSSLGEVRAAGAGGVCVGGESCVGEGERAPLPSVIGTWGERDPVQ
ncbi:unnamed protein product [Vitrella brassicaformis CCMP3155]|uniref:Uncharacterized protein n=1 Tax=Vitrella brassicaformis (strain CCMP3155) TaxID=1169540 RepID=A0A0G4FIK9_VITBC|nr:unnamed protein product [Vitrella brassicaformis CCMP3155]|eukprot:CEM13125.1 unnamed protein product [Vitrella brassicaformis CCMP3155]